MKHVLYVERDEKEAAEYKRLIEQHGGRKMTLARSPEEARAILNMVNGFDYVIICRATFKEFHDGIQFAIEVASTPMHTVMFVADPQDVPKYIKAVRKTGIRDDNNRSQVDALFMDT